MVAFVRVNVSEAVRGELGQLAEEAQGEIMAVSNCTITSLPAFIGDR